MAHLVKWRRECL